LNGLHPGVVILDEPLQQNPDTKHIALFLDFLIKKLAKEASFQTLVFTFLNDSQVQKLRESGTAVVTLEGHLLNLVL
jgi:ABC-type molybdenum transport system ATPase subunit/photorepair protein PhrA